MIFYQESFLFRALAFFLSPLLGLLITAFWGSSWGIIGCLIIFGLIFFIPDFSELSLRKKANSFKIDNIICGEGKVLLVGSQDKEGFLFINHRELLFILDGQIDLKIPLENIKKAIPKDDSYEINEELKKVVDQESPKLPLIVMLVNFMGRELSGYLDIHMENLFFSHTYTFRVTNPSIWSQRINNLINTQSDFPLAS